MEEKRRIGMFRVNFEFSNEFFSYIHNPDKKELVPEICKVFSVVYIVKAEVRHWMGDIEYIGYSRYFDEIEYGSEPPLYDLLFKNDEDGIKFVGFDKDCKVIQITE